MGDIRIGIVGAAGRMGRTLIEEVAATPGCVLGGAAERAGHEAVGQDAGSFAGLKPLGVSIAGDALAVFRGSDVVIDFTVPKATLAHAALALQHKTALVIGTTGLDEGETAQLRAAAAGIPIVWAPNMSLGVNLLLALTERVARALGPDFDIEILEMHHRHKVDAPSGTALALGEAAAAGRKVDLAKVSQRVRDGHTGARRRGDIGFATLRGGDVVGDHSVIFAADGERVEISHRASSRAIFAQGAVRAALWTEGKKPGFYSMQDVLGFT